MRDERVVDWIWEVDQVRLGLFKPEFSARCHDFYFFFTQKSFSFLALYLFIYFCFPLLRSIVISLFRYPYFRVYTFFILWILSCLRLRLQALSSSCIKETWQETLKKNLNDFEFCKTVRVEVQHVILQVEASNFNVAV